jgi:NADPH:quinone reductase-like Zn-dependent oxidoreductase
MSLPETMMAVVMHELGEADVLCYEDVPLPDANENEVLLKVHAASVNHTDIFHRTGRFFIQKELPHILGMDVAGEIVALGKGVKDWKIGDRVVATFEALGRERNGAYAEYSTVPVSELHRIPEALDYQTAASIGLAFTTAWVALMYNGKIRKREKMVIHAASSGVGTAALQIARWKEAHVIAIASVEKAKRLRDLGASYVFDRSSEDLVSLVHTATDEEGASLILDLIGHDSLQASIAMLAHKGRIVCAGTLGGDIAAIDVMQLLMSNGSIIGSFDTLKEGDFEVILEHFAKGTFQPVIDRVMPLSQAADAHRQIENRQAFGKVLLVPDAMLKRAL